MPHTESAPEGERKRSMPSWQPREIIVHSKASRDALTRNVLSRCPDVPVRTVDSGKASEVAGASAVLNGQGRSLLQTVLAGKGVLFITRAGRDTVDVFRQTDERIVCPDFHRIKLASNGCFYRCDWCYLKMTYRAAFPFITVRSGLERVKQRASKVLESSPGPVMFNAGELADSLALEHLTGSVRELIPWFAAQPKGYLFLLTKSNAVDPILDCDHQGRTVLTWSLNNETVSRRFELGAPSLHRRLEAARKAQQAGYRVRIRLDPIVPLPGWREMYARTVREIMEAIDPERITLGTLRFEESFMRMRRKLLTTGEPLAKLMDGMQPMFPPHKVAGRSRPLQGKYSFPARLRTEIFACAAHEFARYTDSPLALCKESPDIWRSVGLEPDRCLCSCQP